MLLLKKYWHYAVILLLVVFILLQKGCNEKKVSNLESQIGMLNVEKQTLQKEVNRLGDTVAIQKAIVVSNQKMLDNYADSVFALKKEKTKTIAYYQNRMKTQIKEVPVPYLVDVPYPEYITDSFARNHMVIVPREFELDSIDYHIQGVVKKEGVLINDITLVDTLSGRFVETKRGLFKSPTIQYQITNTNKHIQIEGTNSIIYKPKKKSFFNRVILPVGIGVLIGITTHAMTQ
jgi:hypothetical protein